MVQPATSCIQTPYADRTTVQRVIPGHSTNERPSRCNHALTTLARTPARTQRRPTLAQQTPLSVRGRCGGLLSCTCKSREQLAAHDALVVETGVGCLHDEAAAPRLSINCSLPDGRQTPRRHAVALFQDDPRVRLECGWYVRFEVEVASQQIALQCRQIQAICEEKGSGLWLTGFLHGRTGVCRAITWRANNATTVHAQTRRAARSLQHLGALVRQREEHMDRSNINVLRENDPKVKAT